MQAITLSGIAEPFIKPLGQDQAAAPENGKAFSDFLKGSIAEVNKLQTEADEAIQELALGRQNDLHHTMIALEKAEVSFKLMMQVRNKIVSAYEEIMRMQV